MVKEIKQKKDTSLDNVDKVLSELVSKGDVFASCPHCQQYLSYAEMELLFCNLCKVKMNKNKILYFHNNASGQNN